MRSATWFLKLVTTTSFAKTIFFTGRTKSPSCNLARFLIEQPGTPFVLRRSLDCGLWNNCRREPRWSY
jgi:hypothetical protein